MTNGAVHCALPPSLALLLAVVPLTPLALRSPPDSSSLTVSRSSSGGVAIPTGVDDPPVDSFGAGEELASSSAAPRSSCCSSDTSVDVLAVYK